MHILVDSTYQVEHAFHVAVYSPFSFKLNTYHFPHLFFMFSKFIGAFSPWVLTLLFLTFPFASFFEHSWEGDTYWFDKDSTQ